MASDPAWDDALERLAQMGSEKPGKVVLFEDAKRGFKATQDVKNGTPTPGDTVLLEWRGGSKSLAFHLFETEVEKCNGDILDYFTILAFPNLGNPSDPPTAPVASSPPAPTPSPAPPVVPEPTPPEPPAPTPGEPGGGSTDMTPIEPTPSDPKISSARVLDFAKDLGKKTKKKADNKKKDMDVIFRGLLEIAKEEGGYTPEQFRDWIVAHLGESSNGNTTSPTSEELRQKQINAAAKALKDEGKDDASILAALVVRKFGDKVPTNTEAARAVLSTR